MGDITLVMILPKTIVSANQMLANPSDFHKDTMAIFMALMTL